MYVRARERERETVKRDENVKREEGGCVCMGAGGWKYIQVCDEGRGNRRVLGGL